MSIEIEGLVVRYGAIAAVSDLSLRVPEGAIFGLLGPNGAGKSSSIRCVATVQVPTAGHVRVGGIDVVARPEEARRLLGVVPQHLALYEALSVVENLRVFGGCLGLSGARLGDRVAWGLALAQLEAHAEKVVGTLSGGMKRRLNIAVSLLHDPRILVFDEPTTGVDPQSRNHIFETVRALHAEGRTVVYTTHYMEEVEALCRDVAIVDKGRLVACDQLDRLVSSAAPRAFEVRVEGSSAEAVRAALAASGLHAAVSARGRSLEDVFLELTGRGLRDAS
ncbi:MAG: ABC transporter ATP-binding protein [Deltaproteobacteria bacterium]|nr:ABC transporter ATP-binding protein [Deltaproteobacteria bacterium]